MITLPAAPPGWVPPVDGVGGWVRLVDAASARLGDEAAVAAGDTWDGLMRRAAGHLARGVRRVAGRSYGARVVVVVGKGDNGGDGWAAAALLRRMGLHVTVASVHPVDVEASAATARVRSSWLADGGRTVVSLTAAGLDEVLDSADVVVDCLLGTGATGAPRGVIADAVAAVNRAGGRGVTVVACDVPTGVDADTGQVEGDAVRADLTVTFGAIKQGLVLHPGAAHVGDLETGGLLVGDLGVGYPVLDRGWAALTAAGAAPSLLANDAEKRTRGVALVVAGAVGTVGAAALAAQSLLAGGAGLVTAATPEDVRGVLATLVPAAMTIGLTSKDGHVAAGASVALDVADFDVIVAGPGMGYDRGTNTLVQHLLRNADRLVLDADAINVFRDDRDRLAEHRGALVLTPHARELARISGRHDAGDHRAEVARELAERFDATIVAKGPRTVVAAPDGRTWITPTGSSALATGGTGDVLAGLVGAAIAKADDVPLAVAQAVWQHGFAGQLAGDWLAGRLTADRLVQRLPRAMAILGQLAQDRPAWPFDGQPLPPRQDRR